MFLLCFKTFLIFLTNFPNIKIWLKLFTLQLTLGYFKRTSLRHLREECQTKFIWYLNYFKNFVRGERRRWRKSKTRRSPSSPHIQQKYIYTWNCSYRTPTERWQKTSDLPKGKKLPRYLGRAKGKRINRDKRTGTGPAPVRGRCEGGKVSTH